MRWIVRTAAVAGVCAFLGAGEARAARFLGGFENGQYRTTVKDALGAEETVHHASSGANIEWQANENLKLRLVLGTVTSNLESTMANDSGLYLQVGASLETNLAMGGGLVLDVSYSIGRTDDYDHNRTGFLAAYVFGTADRPRLYTGVGYNTYTATLAAPATTYEDSQRFSAVVGVRSRHEHMLGVRAASLFGEFGVRLALLFGF